MYDKTKNVTEAEAEEGKGEKKASTTQIKLYASQDGFEEKEKAQEEDQ